VGEDGFNQTGPSHPTIDNNAIVVLGLGVDLIALDDAVYDLSTRILAPPRPSTSPYLSTSVS
jgi:hypothetical protein